MRDETRRDAAREAAEGYAPKPMDGSLMYGFVGVVLALLALFAFSRFYDSDLSIHPLVAIAVIATAFAAAVILRIVRQKRHDTAHRAEYDKTHQVEDHRVTKDHS
jgi:protein-S-isoprenylcysteine O-methyltransferase Ste14